MNCPKCHKPLMHIEMGAYACSTCDLRFFNYGGNPVRICKD